MPPLQILFYYIHYKFITYLSLIYDVRSIPTKSTSIIFKSMQKYIYYIYTHSHSRPCFTKLRSSFTSSLSLSSELKYSPSSPTMDPCPFIRLIVESLSLKLPPTGDGLYSTATPCFSKIAFKKHFSPQTALLPLGDPPAEPYAAAAVFHLDPATIRRVSGTPTALQLSIFSGRTGRTCGVSSGKLLGRVKVQIDLDVPGSTRPVVHHSGWITLGHDPDKPSARLHLVVRSEPDPRFVFQFGGEPECSPVVYQIQGNIQQPVFSCKFSADRNSRYR